MAAFSVKNYRVGMIQTNCYFMINRETGKGFVVDPGDEGDVLARRITSEGFEAEAILLTHAHFDHIMGVEELRKKTGAKVYLHTTDHQTLDETMADMFPQMGRQNLTVPVDEWLAGEPTLQIAGFSVKVLMTPGHTRGGVCYYLEKEGVLFSGDTLFHGSIGRTDFPGGSYSALIRNVEEKLFVLPDDVKVYPGHEGDSTIGYEKKYNPFF